MSAVNRDTPVLFPLFLKLAGRRCLVVGAGSIAESKIASLLASGARVRVVAPRATQRVERWARARRIVWRRGSYREADLRGAFLAIAATSSPKLHALIFRQARRRGILCNVVDDPAHCDFYYPAVVRRGAFQIAISTGGLSPALAQQLRKRLQREFGPEYAAWVKRLGESRERIRGKNLNPETKRKLLHRLAAGAAMPSPQRARTLRKRSGSGGETDGGSF
jgi:precorrin-2 dehydrogenase/sirohydrochlorin ferrochelatase